MKPIQPSAPSPLQRAHLQAAADLQGNADGVVTSQELAQLQQLHTLREEVPYDLKAGERQNQIAHLLATPAMEGTATLDPALQNLPAPLRRLALELDHLWGNADGQISLEEINRVAEYYLSALPFFTEKAELLLELAQHIGIDPPKVNRTAPSIMRLQMALAKVTSDDVQQARPFRDLFNEAMQQADIAGAPELLRDAATHSPKWHRLSILEHTGKAVQAANELAQHIELPWRDAGATMLLHDVGKLLERQVQHEGEGHRFSFWDHEELGAKWLETRGVPEEVAFQVRHHADLRSRSPEEMVALAGGNKQRLANMVLVYVADQLAKGDTPDQLASFDQQRPKILEIAQQAGIDGPKLLAHADHLWETWFPG